MSLSHSVNLEEEKFSFRLSRFLSEELSSQSSPTSFDIREFTRHLVSLSRSYQLDPLLVLAIIKSESDFRPDVKSNAGAIGLMQIRPIVMKEVGLEINILEPKDLWCPYKNTHLGIHYFTFLLGKYRNNMEKALVAYNIGPTALYQKILADEEIPLAYYQKVMRNYRLFKRNRSANFCR